MTGVGSARAAGAALLLLALAGGCGSVAQPPAPRTPAPVQASWPGCEAVGAFVDPHGGGDGPPHVGGVPAGFVPTRAVLCEQGSRTNARGDSVSVDLERTATRIDPLLAYLARSDAPPTDGACPAIGFVPPWLFLLDGTGRYVAPAIPRDGCGLPVDWQGSHAAWLTPPYTDRVVERGAVVETAEAKASGCAMAYKDVVDEYATSAHAQPGRLQGDPFADRSLAVCVYEVPSSDRGTDAPPGAFVAGRRLEVDERSAVVADLLAAPASPGRCDLQNGRFAVVAPSDGGPSLYAELDGCRRVVTDGDPTPVLRATDGLVALLGG